MGQISVGNSSLESRLEIGGKQYREHCMASNNIKFGTTQIKEDLQRPEFVRVRLSCVDSLMK